MATIRLLPVPNTYATGTLTFAGNAANNETVVIGSRTYTWKDTLTGAANEVKVGASAAASVTNLVAAIMDTGVEGTNYGVGTAINADVSAVDGAGDTVVVTAKVDGPSGVVATTETMGSGSWGAAVLTGSGATSAAAPTLTDATAGQALPYACDEALILLRNVDAVTGTTKTATVDIWGFAVEDLRWYKVGSLNLGAAIAETTSDAINYCELVDGLFGFSRLAAVIVAVGGAGTELQVKAACRLMESTSK